MPANERITSQLTAFRIFLGFLLLSLIVRLLLINWYSSPYTDGVYLMTLFESYNPNTNYPPLYSALLYLINYVLDDPLLSGRLLSIVSGLGVISLVFHFGRKFFGERTALYAALICGTTPLAFRWDLRVMTDSLFSLLFLAALYFLYCGLKQQGKSNFLKFNILALLSALTRYQGLVFLPVSALWLYLIYNKKVAQENWWNILSGLSLWLCVPGWMLLRGFGQIQQYTESMSQTFWISAGRFIVMMEMYILVLLYAFGYLASIFMFYGVYRMTKTEDKAPRTFLLICGYLFGAFWLAQSAFMRAFQTRYFFSFWPLAALLCAIGIVSLRERRKRISEWVLVVIFISNIFWSGMVLFFQQDSFGSLKRSAEYVYQNLPQAIIITDEDYKFTYFSNRFIEGKPFSKRFQIFSKKAVNKPPGGSYVYINSLYSPNDYFRYLAKHEKQVVYSDSEVIIPILPDVGIRFTVNSPAWFSYRFYSQTVYSSIVKVGN